MTMHVIWYTAMSMDGRIADAQHSLDFLSTIDGDSGDDFVAFLATIDAPLLGANTMRWLLRGGHGWPHDDLPTWLLSHDEALVRDIGTTRAPLRRVDGSIDVAFDQMIAAGHERIWLCGGGDVASQALQADRIDEVVVTVAPTALGAGPSLFDGAALPMRRFHLAEGRAMGDAARLRWVRQR